jgi:polysaccharide pyruvyl transferase WcaK-like protein
MEPKTCPLDPRLESGNVIGINASPHILKCESDPGMAYENYKNLIAYILEKTDSYVALIPHVVWQSNDDRTVLNRLYEEFGRHERLIPVEDHTAPELKYIISKCRLFVGARTHATIAAYSSGVPTLVVGYSVKARGIARDLFGTEAGYVLPVQSLKEPMELTNAFQEMADREEEIRAHLNQMLPNYCACAKAAVQAVRALEKAL